MAIDDRTGLPIQEGSLQRRILSESSYADFFSEQLFDTYFSYARDRGNVSYHNDMLYDRSHLAVVGERPTPTGGDRGALQRNQRNTVAYNRRSSDWSNANPNLNLDGTSNTASSRAWYGSYVRGLSPTDRVNK